MPMYSWRLVPVASESVFNTVRPAATALFTIGAAALRSMAENVMALYLSLTKVSSMDSCWLSFSAAVGAWKVIGTPTSAEAREAPICAAVQKGATALVKRAYLESAGILASLKAAFSSSDSFIRSFGRYGLAGPAVGVTW